MELGEKLRQARLEAGLSQRQLCGEVITRNMLSQIEHGTARPSMTTLRYLADRLGKPISFFLEETAIQSPNPGVILRAREAFGNGDAEALRAALVEYSSPDPIFDEEWKLLRIHLLLWDAERAMADGKHLLAAELLAQAEQIGDCAAYYTRDLARRVHLAQGRLKNAKPAEICAKLPPMDEELLLRAGAALVEGEHERCLWLLGAAEEQSSPEWNYLRGELHLAQEDFARAAACYRRAEDACGAEVFAKLERCYRELEDYKLAYEYACKQKK